MKSNYKRLGDYIRLVDVRNKDLLSSELLGINIDKYFMPSVANIIGTDLRNYKLLNKGQFACNPMHVGRDEKLPIALYLNDTPAIVSPAYFVFEVADNRLLCKYLMLWFRRAEFDRECWFYTDASVRGGITWEAICDMRLPIPTFAEQQKIVDAYNTIERRIELKRKINENLVTQAKVILKNLYHSGKCFGEKICLDKFCTHIVSGGTPSRDCLSYWISATISWLKNGEVKNNLIFDTEEKISQFGLDNSSAKLIQPYSINMAMYCVSDIQVSMSCIPLATNQAILNLSTDSFRKSCFLYYLLMTYGNEITENANGSAQQNLSKESISAFEFFNPKLDNACFDYFEKNIKARMSIYKNMSTLLKLQSAILCNISH